MERESNGWFARGNKGGPGRSKAPVELKYLKSLQAVVNAREWKAICIKARDQAKGGDPKAREWLSKHLIGSDPVSVLELVNDLRQELEKLRGDAQPETE
jgi:hypothetical protein